MSSTLSATSYIESLSPWPDEFGLERMRRLLRDLGDPQRAYPSIHVVGTNGKGTATRMIEELLAREGLTVGAYYSPHVRSWSERIRVGGDDADFEGAIERVSRAESEAYYRTRPRDARLGAWTSRQSVVIPNRDVLDRRLAELAEQYPDDAIPLPPYWGGFRVLPDSLEFWQSRPNRLHDRLRYVRRPDSSWRVDRLSP